MLLELSPEGIAGSHFVPQNEIVGWAQGKHGLSRPVQAVVIGRELRGIVTTQENETKLRVQTYVKPAGNEFPLRQIPGSHPHRGWSGNEFEITADYSPEFAMGLLYSPASLTKLSKNQELLLLPFLTTAPTLVGASEDKQGHHTDRLPRPM